MFCAGIDTHKDFHVLVIADELGREIYHESFSADEQGICSLTSALSNAGECIVCGIEGTGSYGATLAAHLLAEGFPIVEVSRPKRSRIKGARDKSDHRDAHRAALRALAGEGVSVKPRGGDAQAVQCLLAAYKRLRDTCTSLSNCICALIVSAPEPYRARFANLKGTKLMEAIARTRVGAGDKNGVQQATLTSLKTLERTWRTAHEQAEKILSQMETIIVDHAPTLLDIFGVATVTAAEFIALGGENPSRIKSESAFARAAGAAPIEASSGHVVRHRLDRGGARSANAALHTVVLCRMARDERTHAYVERRTKEGLSKREIMRCLKRYVCREIYRVLCAEERRRNQQKEAS